MKIRLLDAAIVLGAASLLLVLAFGGFDVRIGFLTFRLHGWTRPLLVLALAILWRVSAGLSVRAAAELGLLSMLAAISVAYLQHHVRYAGGLDSYGYVSSASLLASGRLSVDQPLAPLLPFDRAEQISAASAPLGYVAGRAPFVSVPRFPLGLPLVMAPFTVFGQNGPFFVPLLAGLGALVLVFLLARHSADRVTALFATTVVAADPLMFHYAVQPMSDVPAVFWMLAALWLSLNRPDRAVAAGLCAGMAMLTRPALLPAVLVLVVVTADRRSMRSTGVVAATVAAFLVIQLILNRVLYGSVALSGYGPASHMFELSAARLMANAANFGKWLTYSHGLMFWFLWPASLVALRRERWAWQLSAVAAAAALPYLFYLVFDDWESSRFLLLTIILVAILSARALTFTLSHLPLSRLTPLRRTSPHPPHLSHLSHLSLSVLAFLFCFSSHRFLAREGAYQFRSVESKYALVGEWFKTHTSPRAVVLAGLHSGSIRMYGDRDTLRWDEIPPDKLPAMVQRLEQAGRDLYLALDNPAEPPLFETRFGANAASFAEPTARIRVVDIYRFLSAR